MSDRWLDVAGAILDGSPIAWETLRTQTLNSDPVSIEDLRLLADVAQAHRMPDRTGSRWGSLEIIERIGSGTFGDVYRARDAALDRDVALKLLKQSPTMRSRLEGRLLARVRHPNVVTVHGAAEHDGQYGIWMEFIRGETLASALVNHGPFSPREVADVGRDLCQALDAVHRSGLVHGDVKANNVIREDGTGRIVLMDFGTGRMAEGHPEDGRLAGTPLYLAPEVLGGREPDARADVYSTGVLLYYLATGAFPIEGVTLEQVRAAHDSATRVSIRDRRPNIPRELATAIDGALAPADQRTAGATALEAALTSSLCREPRDPYVLTSELDARSTLNVQDVPPEAKPRRATRLVPSIAVGFVAVTAVVGFQAWRRMPREAAHRPTILVVLTEEGQPMANRAEHFTSVAQHELRTAAHLMSDGRLADARRLMRRAADGPLTAEDAVDLAMRDGAVDAVLVANRLDGESGRGWTVRVIDPWTRSTASEAVERDVPGNTDDGLRTAVNRISPVLTGWHVVGHPVQQRVTTSSLRALQLYSEADGLVRVRQPDPARQLLEQALIEDPQFASANNLLAWCLYNLDRPSKRVSRCVQAGGGFERRGD